MEELLVYAVLICAGFNFEYEYGKKLNELFMQNPSDDELLELECKNSVKDAVLYIMSHYVSNDLSCDIDLFGKFLMRKLNMIYCESDIRDFAEKSYHLWKILPLNIQHKEPFIVLSYADEPLSWGDEPQSKELFESMFNFYIN